MNMRIEYKEPLMSFDKFGKVKYIPTHADRDPDHPDCEVGFVSSVNNYYVFVKFAKQLAKLGWSGATAQAVDPLDLVKLEGHWPQDTF